MTDSTFSSKRAQGVAAAVAALVEVAGGLCGLADLGVFCGRGR